jgi:hypothetical protein
MPNQARVRLTASEAREEFLARAGEWSGQRGSGSAELGQNRNRPDGHAPRVCGDPWALRWCRMAVSRLALTILWGGLLIARFVAHFSPEWAQHYSLSGKALNGPVVRAPPGYCI